MIEARGLTKSYGSTTAVDDLGFTVTAGHVTGFVGPNGAGKSTTMRMILGLDRPDRGSATINGRPYREHPAPLREVGALLEARSVHTGRSARHHLLALAQSQGISHRRVDEVIELVGLADVARRRAGGFSLGMGQRLGLAAALLGDPGTLILDEPVNGLDPDGVLWIRRLLAHLASEGRTVFVSSHLMSEMALVATHVIVIGRGRLLADSSVDAFVEQAGSSFVRVRSPQSGRLGELARRHGWEVAGEGESLDLTGVAPERVGELAAEHGIVLHELSDHRASLEDAFLKLTGDVVEYRGVTDRGPSRRARKERR